MKVQAPPTLTNTPKGGLVAVDPRADGAGDAAAKRRKLTMSLSRPMALDQRFMFNGAAFGDAVQVMDRSAADVVQHARADGFAGWAAPSAAPEVPASAALAGSPLRSRAPSPLEDRIDDPREPVPLACRVRRRPCRINGPAGSTA